MPTPTYTPLANITLGSSAASVTFSSISQGYRDLVVVCQVSVTSTTDAGFRFNSDTGSNYIRVTMVADGTSTAAINNTTTAIYGDGVTMVSMPVSGSPATLILNVLDYSATNKHKTVLFRGNQGTNGVFSTCARWASTSAITSLTVMHAAFGSDFSAGSTFALYGIAA